MVFQKVLLYIHNFDILNIMCFPSAWCYCWPSWQGVPLQGVMGPQRNVGARNGYSPNHPPSVWGLFRNTKTFGNSIIELYAFHRILNIPKFIKKFHRFHAHTHIYLEFKKLLRLITIWKVCYVT